MITYSYIAKDPATGEEVKGTLEGSNEQEIAKILKGQGYATLSVKPKVSGNFFLRYKNRISTKDKVIFSRQLSTLLNAGLPLVQSMRSVLNQTQNESFKVVLADVITKVEGGVAFSKALEQHTNVFNQVFISLVAAGETSGTLDDSLDRLASQQEKDAELVSKVRGALIYPVIVMIVMIGVVGFMVVAVLPQVGELYKGIPGAKLPFLTVALLTLSNFVTGFWWAVLIVLGLAGFFTTRWARTITGKSAVDSIKLHAPLLGPLFSKLYMARFARTGTTLVSSGVPIIQTLEITGRAISNVHVEDSLKAAIEKVKGGKSLSSSLENDPNFLELVPQMIKIGEDSGTIEQMLEKIATYYEKEVDNAVKSISTIVEPLLMIILGVVALIIVGAILLPIYGLVGQGVLG